MAGIKGKIAEEEKKLGPILKLFAKLQKLVAKEFLWIISIVLLSAPIGLLLLFLLDIIAPALTTELEQTEHVDILDIYIILYLVSGGGIYFIRVLVNAIRLMVAKKEE